MTQVQRAESTVLAVRLAREPQSERARTSTQMERAGTGEGGLTAGSHFFTLLLLLSSSGFLVPLCFLP